MNTSTQSKVNTNGVYKMTEELEKLEKEFILSEDMEHEDIKGLIQKILGLWKIDNKGFVVINKSQLRVKDKIMLVLSARHLANKLQQKLGRGELISEEVPIKDVASTIREKDNVVAARLSDLKDEGKVVASAKGVYKVAPYAIKQFLSEMESEK